MRKDSQCRVELLKILFTLYEGIERWRTNIFSLNFSGGALVDLGVYPLSAAISLFGKPVETAYYPTKITTGVDGSGTLILTYPSFICTILCSKISTSHNPSEIQGEEGTFIVDDMGAFANVTFKANHTVHEESLINGYPHHDMIYEVESFINIIKENDQKNYKKLKEISANVLEITEKVRRENNIIYKVEKWVSFISASYRRKSEQWA